MQPDQPTEVTSPPVYTREPPASVDGVDPVSQSQAQSTWPYILFVILVFVTFVGGIVIIKNFDRYTQGLFGTTDEANNVEEATDNVANSCFAFRIPARQLVYQNGPLCSIDTDSTEYKVTTELLPADITQSGLQRFADQNFKSQNPTVGANAIFKSNTTFAGKPTYKISWRENGQVSARYYIYNQTSELNVRGKQYKAFAVTLTSRLDFENLETTVKDSWQWQPANPDSDYTSELLPISSATTPCYKFKAPDSATMYEVSNCEIRVQYVPYSPGSLYVRYLTGSKSSLQDYVAQWKAQRIDFDEIISEADISIGGLEAHKIVYRALSYPAADYEVSYLVTTGASYVPAANTQGFEINGIYDSRSNDDKTVDAMITSWQWK